MIGRRIRGCVCPSEILREELEARGWSLQHLAAKVYEPGSREWAEMVLASELYLACGPENLSMRIGLFADELGTAFGMSGDFWRNLEAAWLANAVEGVPARTAGDTP